MKARINYKSKKTIIIAVIILALIIISGIAIGMFIKANDTAEAVGGNNTITDGNNNVNENETAQNQTGIEGEQEGETAGNAGEGENQENLGNDENVNNEENNTENQEGNEAGNNNAGNANNQENAGNNNNAGNANNNATNVPETEFVVGRTEIIPEKVISENYSVSWKPRQFNTTIENQLNTSNITAVKTVAKITANGVLQNAETAKVGDILQYTITLTNNHEKINGVVTVNDIIPWGTEFVSATAEKLTTIPSQYEEAKEVTALTWKNVKVEANSEVRLVVYVRILEKVEEKIVTVVKNIATVTEGRTTEEIESPETKIANITKIKTSKVIYNEEMPHEHIAVEGIDPLHELDFIEYTIKIENNGAATGTVEVTDTVPEGTTFVEGSKVIVVDKNGTSEYEMQELVEGIDVTIASAEDVIEENPEAVEEPIITKVPGTATVTFRVIVNTFEEETKTIINDMAKVDRDSTNPTEDIAQKVYINITATKVWENLENDAAKDEYSIQEILFVLKANEEEIDTKSANTNNNWAVDFGKLAKYKDNAEIIYTVAEKAINGEEQKVLEHYNSKINYEKGLTNIKATITNAFDPAKLEDTIEIKAEKVWVDNGSAAAEEYKMSSITFEARVYAQDGSYEVKQTKEVTAGENGEWKVTFEGLAEYDENGNKIVYVIDEVVTNPEDQAKLDVYNKVPSTKEDGTRVITNTFDPNKVTDTIEIKAEKVWVDNGSAAAEAYKMTSITFEARVYAQDGSYEVKQSKEVTAGKNGEWKVTFEGLAEYDENGNKIVYVIDEVVKKPEDQAKLDVYNSNKSTANDGTIVITNTFDLSKVNDTVPVTITKIWDDNSDKYKIRPESVILTVKNGKTEINNYTLTAADDTDKSTTDVWTRIINLPKYDQNGNLITYTVVEKEENVPEGYTKTSENETTVTNKVNDFKQEGTVTVQQVIKSDENVSTPMDVVFVIDTSGSMRNKISVTETDSEGNTTTTEKRKAKSVVDVVNQTIELIKSKNADSRIGVVAYGTEKTNTVKIVPLGKYNDHEGDYLQFTSYQNDEDETVYRIKSKIDSSKYRNITGGTNTQAGIQAGATMLTSTTEDSRKFETTLNGEKVTETRTPVIILVTDGEPTFYYPSETLEADKEGKGNTSDTDENYYYWTLRTAKYYKDEVTKEYYGTSGKKAKMFTIGIGLNSVGARTMLDPNADNVKNCKNAEDGSHAKLLYELLDGTGDKEDQLSTTRFSYADGTASGALTENDIKNFLFTSIEVSSSSSETRDIKEEESEARRINLDNLEEGVGKTFSLKLVGEKTEEFSSTSTASKYVKKDPVTNEYYLDLSQTPITTKVYISYWIKNSN